MRRRKYSDEYRSSRQTYSPDLNPIEQIARTAIELQKIFGVDCYDTKYLDTIYGSNDKSWEYDKYYSLCVSNLPYRLTDYNIRDALYHECKSFGDFNVKISSYNGQRVAYINFRSSREAAKARGYLKNFKIDSKLVHVEPVIQKKSRSPRNCRSRSPYSQTVVDNHPRNYRHSGSSHSPIRHNRRRSRSVSRTSNKITNVTTTNTNTTQFKDKFNFSSKETGTIPTRTLFVGNLPHDIIESDLKDLFGKYGDLTDIDIKKPTSNRPGNSYAFIKFENLDIANEAKNNLSGHIIRKCQLKIGFGKVNPTNCVWIGGLGPWILYDAFEKEMVRFGPIKQIQWPQNKNYAYVLYDSVDIAIAAVNKLRGSFFGDNTKQPIRIDFADSSVIKNGSVTKSSNNNNNSNNHNNDSETTKIVLKKSSKVPKVTQQLNDELSIKSAKSVSQLINCLNDVWTGMIILKNNNFGCRLYMLKGERSLINYFMFPPQSDENKSGIGNLTITQRMKLDPQKLSEMSQRIECAGENGFCLMLASSYVIDTKLVSDSSQPQRPLKSLITYLRTKESAGVIFLKSYNLDKNYTGVLHAFPPCDFSFDILLQKAPNLTKDFLKDDFLVILLIRNSG